MSIFTHVVVGTNDLDQARQFYDAVLATLGIPYMGPLGQNGAIYQSEGYQFIVTKPTNGQPATHANGGTIGTSPTPLTPCGCFGFGTSTRTVSIIGRSEQTGIL